MTAAAKVLKLVDVVALSGDIEPDHKQELRVWLRLFACTTLIENEIRRRLREQFEFTLPRFDLLAQLDKAEDGLVLGEVSRRLMVSPGNITAITERLMESGYITRLPAPSDRRIQIIRMTHAGRAAFRTMADAHSEWISELFAGLSPEDLEVLKDKLVILKRSTQTALGDAAAAPKEPLTP